MDTAETAQRVEELTMERNELLNRMGQHSTACECHDCANWRATCNALAILRSALLRPQPSK